MKKTGKTMGGLAILGVILLIVGGVIFAVSYPYGKGAAAVYSDRFRQEIDVNETVEAADLTDIKIVTDIKTVFTSTKENSVTIQAKGTVYRANPFADFTTEVTSENGVLNIRFMNYHYFSLVFMPLWNENTAVLEIGIPADYTGNFNYSQTSQPCDLTLPNIFNNVRVNSTSGELTLGLKAAGNLTMEMTSGTSKGSIQAEGNLSVEMTSGHMSGSFIAGGDMSVEMTSGRMNVNHVSAKNLKVYSTSGEINLSGVDVDRLDMEMTSGRGELTLTRPASADIELTSGNLTVAMPKPDTLNMQFRFTATSGRMNDGFFEPGTQHKEYSTRVTGTDPLLNFRVDITSGAFALNKTVTP